MNILTNGENKIKTNKVFIHEHTSASDTLDFKAPIVSWHDSMCRLFSYCFDFNESIFSCRAWFSCSVFKRARCVCCNFSCKDCVVELVSLRLMDNSLTFSLKKFSCSVVFDREVFNRSIYIRKEERDANSKNDHFQEKLILQIIIWKNIRRAQLFVL